MAHAVTVFNTINVLMSKKNVQKTFLNHINKLLNIMKTAINYIKEDHQKMVETHMKKI